jgi:hypothetical protein
LRRGQAGQAGRSAARRFAAAELARYLIRPKHISRAVVTRGLDPRVHGWPGHPRI